MRFLVVRRTENGLRFGIDREQRGIPSTLANPSNELFTAFGYEPTASGITVTPQTALRMQAVYSAVSIIAETIASLPWHVYRQEGRNRLRVDDDPRRRVLAVSPNSEWTAINLWESVLGWLLTHGNAYLWRGLDSDGFTSELWVLNAANTYPVRTQAGEKAYKTTVTGEELVLLPEEVIHVRGFGLDWLGLSPIEHARQAIGTALAAEQWAGSFYLNDASPGGYLSIKHRLTDEQFKRAVDRFRIGHQGLNASHRFALLDDSAEWKEVGIPQKDAQFIESLNFGVAQIARLYRIPGYKLGLTESGMSYNSVEMQELAFLKMTLRPWITRLEQAVNKEMFSSSIDQGRGIYAQMSVEGLLRGSSQERAGFYKTMIEAGIMTRNEARELEDWIALEGLDAPILPANMTVVGEEPEDEPEPDPSRNGNGDVDPALIKELLDMQSA